MINFMLVYFTTIKKKVQQDHCINYFWSYIGEFKGKHFPGKERLRKYFIFNS